VGAQSSRSTCPGVHLRGLSVLAGGIGNSGALTAVRRRFGVTRRICATSFSELQLFRSGGEGGIRTLSGSLESKTYKIHDAGIARGCQGCRRALPAIARGELPVAAEGLPRRVRRIGIELATSPSSYQLGRRQGMPDWISGLRGSPVGNRALHQGGRHGMGARRVLDIDDPPSLSAAFRVSDRIERLLPAWVRTRKTSRPLEATGHPRVSSERQIDTAETTAVYFESRLVTASNRLWSSFFNSVKFSYSGQFRCARSKCNLVPFLRYMITRLFRACA
jgi:hypothetical protein